SYAIILAAEGDPAAVTIDTTIHFLRAAMSLPLCARTTPARLGRRLAVTETMIFSVDAPERTLVRAISTWARS
ncbi:MAG: PaaI family thioesterase, partial [Rhodospirillaceae bacterium]